MGIESAKIVYLTDTANDNAKILPKSIGSAIIHKPSNDYETTDQTTVSAELDKHTTSIETEANNVDDIQTEIGTETLSTTSQNLVGAINEINGGLSAIPGLLSEVNFGSSSGYAKWNNGLLVQWGKVATSARWVTITLPLPFADTNYFTYSLDINRDTGSAQTGYMYSMPKTVQTFEAGCYVGDNCLRWLAIGQAG